MVVMLLSMLYLAIRDLWAFMQSKRLLFILLFLGFVVALYSTLYLITVSFDDIVRSKEFTDYDRKVTINYVNKLPDSEASHALFAMLEKWGWGDYTVFYYAESNMTKDRDIIVAACNVIPPDFLTENFGFKEGEFLSYEDIHNNASVCVVTHTVVDYTHKASWLGQTLLIDGMNINIKGVFSYPIYWISDTPYLSNVNDAEKMDQIVVPAGLLRHTDLPIIRWEIVGDAKPTPGQLQNISDWIERYTPDAVVEWPISLTESYSWKSFLIRIAYQIVIMGLALINMTAILVSWVYSQRRQWYAFYICGASKGRLLVLVLLEMLLMSLLAALPIGFGYLASDTLFTWGTISYRLTLPKGIGVYLALMMVATCVVLVRSIPAIRHIVQKRGR